MALNGFATYVPTADEINSHWVDVNADRVANMLAELLLQGGFARAAFVTQRDELDQAIVAVQSLENAREIATDTRDAMKRDISDRLAQFRDAVALHLKATAYFGALPTIPQFGLAESKFLRPFDDMADLWARINAAAGIPGFTGPLLLRAGYTLAQFQADLQALRDQFKAVTEAENDISIGRRRRDSLLAPLRERMLQYRRAIELEYAEGHLLRDSLPNLYSPGGGTPTIPTARYKTMIVGTDTKVTIEVPTGLVDIQTMKLVHGGTEFFTAFSPTPGTTVQTTWPGMAISGAIDEVKIQNGANEDIAVGEFDPTLPDPGP